MFLALIQLCIVMKRFVNLVCLNQIFRKYTRICCFLNKLTPQECFQHLLYLTQTHGMFSAPPVLNRDTSTSHNANNNSIRSTYASADLSLDTQDEEILNILEELQGSANQRIAEECTDQCRLTGNFVSDTLFNLINKVLSDTEIQVLEKGLDFAPIQNKINEPELRRDFKEFC